MNTITKDLGAVTAYAVAVANGYTGTEAEWAQQLAGASQNASTAQQQAAAAASSATAANTAKTAAQAAQSAAEAAAATASAAYGTDLIADNYSASKTYAIGDLVIYDGGLYQCKTNIGTAEAWTSAHWAKVNVSSEVSGLKSAVNNRLITNTVTGLEYLRRYIRTGNQSTEYSIGDATTICSAWINPPESGEVSMSAPSGYMFYRVGEYTRRIDSTQTTTGQYFVRFVHNQDSTSIRFEADSSKWYFVCTQKTDSSTYTLDEVPEEVKQYTLRIPTDKTLSQPGKAADAKVTGDSIGSLESALNGGTLTVRQDSDNVIYGSWTIGSNNILKLAGTTMDTYYTLRTPIDISGCVVGSQITTSGSVINSYGVFIVDADYKVLTYVSGNNPGSLTPTNTPQEVTLTVPEGAKYLISDIRSAKYTGIDLFDATMTVKSLRDEVNALDTLCNINQENIASGELDVATVNHAVGDLIICKNQLYKVTAAIAAGETITPGTNVTATTVAAQISAAKASVYDDLAMKYRLAKYSDISTSYIFDHDIRTGQYISVGQHLLRATADIYSGNTLIPGTNCVFANVGEVLTDIIEQLN